MPAKSAAQQEVMGMAHAIQQGKMSPKSGTASAKIAKTMKPGDVNDFASTPRKGLPVHTISHKLKTIPIKRKA